ncbi:acyl carrier protein [Clostridium sp. AM58-1XD]|uniref:acyl carrier protein n=1 Tax=Clostridium sp. AM58-1XD TaxID=2292307 RepID=UPI000E4BB684|nr:acyl carrier protein [Clostridium sp. AM58-1XD]RGZ01534.1 acyl carrier protein [Clostridium sp. AM58-1XD]
MEFERMRAVLADQFNIDPEEITMGSRLVADFGADSLDIAELIAAIQEEFDVYISEEAAEGIATVGDLLEKIR